MGKYRDHRQPRKRVYDPYQRDERPEPSYFERSVAPAPQPAFVDPTSRAAEDAELLWFNSSRCFGFVKLSDGSSAYLHASRLQAAGYNDLSEGSLLTVRTEIGTKGPQVAEVVSVTMSGGPVAGHPIRAGSEPPARTDPEGPEHIGVVKRYDPIKGFGFITTDDGDVFVHATALTRSGMSALEAGQNVLVRLGTGRKGVEVRSIRLS
jgi:CspA family cold shock protein